MNTVVTVVVGGILVGMLFLMVKYARFIHKGPLDIQEKRQENPGAPDEKTLAGKKEEQS